MFFPDKHLRDEWEQHVSNGAGSTEPWTLQVVSSLLIAAAPVDVLEIGTFEGYGSAWLCRALDTCGGKRNFTGIEIDMDRALMTDKRLRDMKLENVNFNIVAMNSLSFLEKQEPFSYQFVWLDGDHNAAHVEEELSLLIDRGVVGPGGMICMHDVDGPFGLGAVCEAAGGYVLRFPKLHVGGGLGVIQL